MLTSKFVTATLTALTMVGTAGLVYATSTPSTPTQAPEPQAQAQPAMTAPVGGGNNNTVPGGSSANTVPGDGSNNAVSGGGSDNTVPGGSSNNAASGGVSTPGMNRVAPAMHQRLARADRN